MTNDLPAALPESVTVVFPTITGNVHPIEVLLADLGLDIGTAQGFDGTKVFHDTPVWTTALNDRLQTLAERIAADWYKWRLARPAQLYIGVVDWDMEGHTDIVEFENNEDVVTTRAVRGPWLEHHEDFMHSFVDEDGAGAGSDEGSGDGSGSDDGSTEDCNAEVYKYECIDGLLNKYVSVLTISGVCLSQSEWFWVGTEGCCECSGSGATSGSGDPGGGGGGVELDCCGCIVMPRQYLLVVSGVAGGDCADCATYYNGTYTLTYQGGCEWRSSPADSPQDVCTGTATRWILQVLGSGGSSQFVLQPGSVGVSLSADYTRLCSSWSCLGSNTLTLSTTPTANCTNWPATLTVIPI